jgi:hypothetical protein
VGITIPIIIMRQVMTTMIIVNMRLIIRAIRARATTIINTTHQHRTMIITKAMLLFKSTQITRIGNQKFTVRIKSRNRMTIIAITNTMLTTPTTIPQKSKSNIQPKIIKMKVG